MVAQTREKKSATKNELVDRLATKTGLPRNLANDAYDAMVEILAENIREGRGTSFRGVGIVTVERKPARTMRVPVSDEPVEVAERTATNFTMVRAFAAGLRGDGEEGPDDGES